jgi:voltage-gated potassium channel Kch
VRVPTLQIERFRASERGLTALLVSLTVGLFVVRPFESVGYELPLLNSMVFTGILLSGIVTVSRSRPLMLLFTVVAVASGMVHWARYTPFGADWVSTDAIASFVACGTLGAIVLVEVLREGPITSQRIQGAIAAYLLIALMFAAAYTWIDVNVPSAFAGAAAPFALQRDPLGRFAYFSFVTLTTVGYGDIVPQTAFARALAVLEALIGQLFPAILLARLVSMELYYRQRRFEREQAALDREELAREVARVLREGGGREDSKSG